MTVEEIEIQVKTKVEEALKDFDKLAPNIKKQLEKVQQVFSKVDMSEFKNAVTEAVRYAKKQLQSLKLGNTKNKIKIEVTNDDANQQIKQTEKELDSLKKKTTQRYI